MNVWVVMCCDEDAHEGADSLSGIFDSEEKANKFMNACNEDSLESHCYFYVEDWMVL